MKGIRRRLIFASTWPSSSGSATLLSGGREGVDLASAIRDPFSVVRSPTAGVGASRAGLSNAVILSHGDRGTIESTLALPHRRSTHDPHARPRRQRWMLTLVDRAIVGLLVPWKRDALHKSRSAAPGSQSATTENIGHI